MNRREFFRRSIPAATLPFLIGGYRVHAYGRTPLLEALLSASATDRVLVLVQLNGGNDGLNTVIPLDGFSQLAAARQNILLDESKVLKLTDATGLHPAMTGMQGLFQNGQLAVVQGVSYPNPNFSHFRATDIWLTAADYNQILTSGWLGRYLDQEFPGYPDGYPSAAMPDPLGIQIGSIVTPAFNGPANSMGLAITDPTATYILPGGSDVSPSTPAGHELTFIRQVAEQAQSYSTVVKAAAAKASNKSTLYPTKGQNSLADQLRIVAQLIAGGLKTRIYVVNLGGFDTHSAQVDKTDFTIGTQATLLGRLSVAITAFLDDIRLLGMQDRVIGMTFSEFGRRIKSNASLGTDHGTAAPVFVFGAKVNGGLVGANPVLPASAGVNDNLAMQYDFRSVYATILQDWFGASGTELSAVLLKSFQKLPLITPSSILAVEEPQQVPQSFGLDQNYPNPFNPSTTISYELASPSDVTLTIYDALGREVTRLVSSPQAGGRYTVRWDGSRLSSGTYFYRLEARSTAGSGSFVQTKEMTLIR
ncbi:MAG TPA: DUF1501 domain-containing protein [Bacteroidota bacterium]